MKDNLYTLLNEIDNQIDYSQSFEADINDVNQWKMVFHSKIKKKTSKRQWMKYVAASAILLILTMAIWMDR